MSPSRSISGCVRLSLAVLAAAACALPGEARALPGDRTQPVNIRADRIRVNQRTGLTTYYGHVTLVQGSLHIDADRITASYHGNAVERIDAYGHPVHFRERPAPKTPEVTGTALHVTYTASKHLLELRHKVVLHQDQNLLTGPEMRYDLLTEQLFAHGNAAEGRVRTVLQPKTRAPGTPK